MMAARALSVYLALVAFAVPAEACTLCHSDTAALVRGRLLAPDFLENLLGVVAPLPLLFGAILAAARS